MLLAFVLGSAGDLLVRWASPPLELVDAGEKRRWSLARTYAWQGTRFALALVSILLAVTSPEPRCRYARDRIATVAIRTRTGRGSAADPRND